jgi:hypothetical protein
MSRLLHLQPSLAKQNLVSSNTAIFYAETTTSHRKDRRDRRNNLTEGHRVLSGPLPVCAGFIRALIRGYFLTTSLIQLSFCFSMNDEPSQELCAEVSDCGIAAPRHL